MDRSNSFIGSSSLSSTVEHLPADSEVLDGLVVIVDPVSRLIAAHGYHIFTYFRPKFSTGAHLAGEVCRQGLKCCRVLSSWDSPVAALVQQGIATDYCATVQHNNTRKDVDAALDEVSKGREVSTCNN